MNALGNITPYIAPLVVFGLVVFVHELGHFLAAKLTGVYAPVFSLGWGRRLFGVRRGETDYRVSLIPLGGYVRMATQDDDAMAGIEGGVDRGSLEEGAGRPEGTDPRLWDEHSMKPFGPKPVPEDRWVERKSVPARVLILSAGVIMNILLTIGVSTGIFYRYGNTYRPAVVDSVVAGAPAAAAGMLAGDRIVAIDGQSIKAWDQVIDRVSAAAQDTLRITVERRAQRVDLSVTPQAASVANPVTGVMERVGRIGVAAGDSIAREPVGIAEAVGYGGRATWAMASNVMQVLGGLLSGQVSPKNLGGPIAIARTSVQAAKSGAETLWSLIAFLSVNIAMINLVPIPVLDGGQIVLVLAEAAKGKAFSARTRETFARVGVLAVLALILLVTFNDLKSAFTR